MHVFLDGRVLKTFVSHTSPLGKLPQNVPRQGQGAAPTGGRGCGQRGEALQVSGEGSPQTAPSTQGRLPRWEEDATRPGHVSRETEGRTPGPVAHPAGRCGSGERGRINSVREEASLKGRGPH